MTGIRTGERRRRKGREGAVAGAHLSSCGEKLPEPGDGFGCCCLCLRRSLSASNWHLWSFVCGSVALWGSGPVVPQRQWNSLACLGRTSCPSWKPSVKVVVPFLFLGACGGLKGRPKCTWLSCVGGLSDFHVTLFRDGAIPQKTWLLLQSSTVTLESQLLLCWSRSGNAPLEWGQRSHS